MGIVLQCDDKSSVSKRLFHKELGTIGQMWNQMIDIGTMLPVKWQKDHSGRGFFHKEMGTKSQAILSKWQNGYGYTLE